MASLKIAHMATWAPRLAGAVKRVHELVPQCDLVRVYANALPEIPAQLRGYQDQGVLEWYGTGADLGSQGKLFWLHEDRDHYYLCVDDDIIYPMGYADFMVKACDKYEGKALISMHGGRFRIHGTGLLPQDRPCKSVRRLNTYDTLNAFDIGAHILGNGVSIYRPGIVHMTGAVIQGPWGSGDDEDVAVFAQRRRIPCVVCAHPGRWVLPDNEHWPVQALHMNKPMQGLSDIKLKQWRNWQITPAQETR